MLQIFHMCFGLQEYKDINLLKYEIHEAESGAGLLYTIIAYYDSSDKN